MPPQSPNPDFDFMLKNQQPAKRGLPLPGLNLPRPIKITLFVALGIILLVIISSLLRGGSSNSTAAITGVLARGQETLRVTQLVQQQLQLQDPQAQGLAATISNSLSSDQVQLKNYLARNHAKINAALLASDIDKNTDSSMQTASENNGLDDAYKSYLKGALAKYENDLQAAYKLAGPNGKKILSDAIDGVQTLLSSPPLKS